MICSDSTSRAINLFHVYSLISFIYLDKVLSKPLHRSLTISSFWNERKKVGHNLDYDGLNQKTTSDRIQQLIQITLLLYFCPSKWTWSRRILHHVVLLHSAVLELKTVSQWSRAKHFGGRIYCARRWMPNGLVCLRRTCTRRKLTWNYLRSDCFRILSTYFWKTGV